MDEEQDVERADSIEEARRCKRKARACAGWRSCRRDLVLESMEECLEYEGEVEVQNRMGDDGVENREVQG